MTILSSVPFPEQGRGDAHQELVDTAVSEFHQGSLQMVSCLPVEKCENSSRNCGAVDNAIKLGFFSESLNTITDESSAVSSDVAASVSPFQDELDAEELKLLEAVSTAVPCNVAMAGFVPILEASGGVDKGPNGLRC